MNFIDLTGRKIGMIFVQRYAGNGRWTCLCECGTVKNVGRTTLRGVKSCGCARRGNLKHGKRHTSEYTSWVAMRSRCNNPKNNRYHSHGGRGIVVCERWQNSFENFLADMGNKPSSRHSLDRTDNSGNYCAENCRWASPKVQSRNTRRNRSLTYNGRTMLLAEWSDELGMKRTTITQRIDAYGWSVEKALSTPVF